MLSERRWSRLAHRLDDVEARFKASAEVGTSEDVTVVQTGFTLIADVQGRAPSVPQPILRAARTAINDDHDYNTAEVLARLRPTPVVLAPAVTNVERTASAALSSIRAADSTESAPTPSDLLLPLGDNDEQAQPPASAPTARQSREASSPSLSAQPAPAQGMSTLLSHHRSEQDSLTDELASMASRLKANSLAFADMLSKDRDLMDSAEKKLEGNLDGMTRERERLKGYTKKGGVTTWFVIGSVVAVLLAWLFMFGLMRIA